MARFRRLTERELEVVSGGERDSIPTEEEATSVTKSNEGRWCKALGIAAAVGGAYHMSRAPNVGGYAPTGEALLQFAEDSGDAVCDWWDGV